MKKTILQARALRWTSLIAVAASTLLLLCANPSDETLKWRMNVQLPITANRVFEVGKMIDTLFFGGDTLTVDTWNETKDSIVGTDTNIVVITHRDTTMMLHNAYTDTGNTVIFTVVKKDSQFYDVTEDSLDDKIYDDVLGPIPLGNFGATNSLPYAAGAGTLSSVVPIPLAKIYYIAFSSGNMLNVILRNRSATATITNASVGLVGVDTVTGITIGPSGIDTAQLDVGAHAVDSTPRFVFSIPYVAAAAGDFLEVSFSLAGLTADSVVVNDSLIDVHKTFTNNYMISDSVDMEYVDMSAGTFTYSITNNSKLTLHLLAIHRHLWETPYCNRNGLTSIDTLGKFSSRDSSFHFGNLLSSLGTDVPPGGTWAFSQNANVAGTRLFPEWMGDSCVTIVDYVVSVKPTNTRVGVSRGNRLVFTITGKNFKFKEFEGILMLPYSRIGDTQYVAVDLPFIKGTTDSLRDNFHLYNVTGNINIVPVLPEKGMNNKPASLSNFTLDFMLFDKRNIGDSAQKTVTLSNVHNDTTYLRQMPLTNVLNRFPDSVGITANLRVPAGTRMHVINDLEDTDPDYYKLIGRMVIGARANLKIDGYLDWAVFDTVNLQLGVSKMKFDAGSVKLFRKMQEKIGTLELGIENHSNLYMRLYGLLAPAEKVGPLDSLVNESYPMMVNSTLASANGYLNLLGNGGILIPSRNISYQNSIRLEEATLNTILDTDSISIRWLAQFLVQGQDALADTNYLKINSSLHIEGVNSMDSVFSE